MIRVKSYFGAIDIAYRYGGGGIHCNDLPHHSMNHLVQRVTADSNKTKNEQRNAKSVNITEYKARNNHFIQTFLQTSKFGVNVQAM